MKVHFGRTLQSICCAKCVCTSNKEAVSGVSHVALPTEQLQD